MFNKIKTWFKREILPFIVVGLMGLAFIGFAVLVFWLDRIRFIY